MCCITLCLFLFYLFEIKDLWWVSKRRGRDCSLWGMGGGQMGLEHRVWQMLLEGNMAGNSDSGPVVDDADGARIECLHHLKATDTF